MPHSTIPPYPYDKHTGIIQLPSEINHELFHLAQDSGLPTAMKRVMELTGAGLKVSKDYVEALLQRR